MLHNLRTGSRLKHHGEQTEKSSRHSHQFRTKSPGGAVNNGFGDIFIGSEPPLGLSLSNRQIKIK
jgi:hypothetical protein